MRLSAAASFSLAAAASSPRSAAAFSTVVGGRASRLAPHHRGAPSIVANHHHRRCHRTHRRRAAVDAILRRAYSDDDNANASSPPDDDDDEATPPSPGDNPYADPNYPDLEFVNYDDPEYSAFGEEVDDPSWDESRTLAEIEAMREERRRKNDEYQFETYHATVLRGGERSLGEWTVFQTDTFMGSEVVGGRNPESWEVPRLLKRDVVLKVVSQGTKVIKDASAEWRVDGERIVHEERLATIDDFPTLMNVEDEERAAEELLKWEIEDVSHVENTFWPEEMMALDFRGPGGNMCVGKAYTICHALPLEGKVGGDDLEHEGPFSEMRTELGVQEDGMRFRIKMDYALLEEEVESSTTAPPPLHLRTLTVCRETLDGYWPDPSDNEEAKKSEEGGDDENEQEGGGEKNGEDKTERKMSEVRRKNQRDITAALFGPPGAPGGLYDPPPVGNEERAVGNYMLLDFEGGATVLLPHKLEQHHDEGDGDGGGGGDGGPGWVTSLDWTPGRIRYQVDRKVLGGKKLKGLKTLELSEVQGQDADRWRPRDGGADMRQ